MSQNTPKLHTAPAVSSDKILPTPSPRLSLPLSSLAYSNELAMNRNKDSAARQRMSYYIEGISGSMMQRPYQVTNANSCHEILCKIIQGDIEYIKQYFTRNPQEVHEKSTCGRSYLSVACRLGDRAIVELLIKNGAIRDMNAPDDKGLTPLHYAVLGNDLQVMTLILNYGAGIHDKNKEGYSPLHLAILKKSINLVKLLLHTAGDSVKTIEPDGNDRTLLQLACDSNDVDMVKLLLKYCVVNVDYDTPLHLACCIGHIDSMKLILQSEPDSNVVSKNGFTALHIACDKGFIDIIELLMHYKSDINIVSTTGDTALHLACRKRFVDIVKLLIKFNADVDIVNSCGYAALHIACDNGFTDIVDLLIQSKFDVDMVSTNGYAALHIACNKGFTDIVNLLIQSGVDTNRKDNCGETPLHCAVLGQHYDVVKLMLSQANVKFDICNPHNQTPFLQAISNGNLGIMQMLLLKGADFDAINKDGDNCLHITLGRKKFHSEGKHLEILNEISFQLKEDRLSSIVVAAYLAKQGANFYHKNKNNTTPLDMIKNSDLKDRLKLYLSKVYECYVCGNNQVSIKFHPCGHRVTCEDCCSKIEIKKCSQCKQPVTRKTRFDGSEIKTANSSQDQEHDDKITCKICMERRWNMVFDCGHTTCEKCGEMLNKCHLCRKNIQKKIIIH